VSFPYFDAALSSDIQVLGKRNEELIVNNLG